MVQKWGIMENKKPWESKTVILNLILAIAAIVFPPAVKLIQDNPELVAIAFTGLNIVLRLITKKPISIS